MRFSPTAAAAVGLLLGGLSPAISAEQIEVLHYWTSGGESKAVNVLKTEIEKKGFVWKDSAIAGGGGQNAMTVLKTRSVAGDPPAAVQMRGPAVQDWADLGALVPLDQVAGNWSKMLPPAIYQVLTYKDKVYAAPHWVHRVNWMYINKQILDKVGAQVPTTREELAQVADKMKAAGYIAIAHGETAYEDGVLFEGIVQSRGIDFYRKAILEGDQASLKSPVMVSVFDELRASQKYFDEGQQGRPWNLAAAMVIEGKAGMMFMGDWANGEFKNAGKVPGKDYVCAPVPGTGNMYTFIADTFVFFKQHDQPASPGQLALASLIMTPEYQEKAAFFKGAIPAITAASIDNFDDCAKKSAADLKSSIASNTLITSQNQGTSEARLGAIRDTVVKFMNSKQDSKSAAEALANAVKAAM